MINDSTEIAAIMKTLELYRDGTYEGSVETLRKVFHPKAILSGWVVTPQSPNGALMCESMEVLYGMMAPEDAPNQKDETLTFHIDNIDVCGNIASAKVIEKNLDGGNYANYLQLHKVDGTWLVTSKAFYEY